MISSRHNRQFSYEELEYVRDMYPVSTAREIAKSLGRRNAKSIRNLARELGVQKERKWTDGEKRILRNQYGRSDFGWLCRRLNRSKWSVMHMVRRMQLQRLKTWTKADDEQLRQMLPTNDLHSVAAHFGVSVFSVEGRCRRIGISRRRIPQLSHPWK